MQASAGVRAGLDRPARTFLQQLVLTRAWVADHGGLFVQQRPGVEPNPFLRGKEEVIRKCSCLDGEEMENMHAHVPEGARIIRHADFLLCAFASHPAPP